MGINFHGVIAAIVTPFDKNEELDARGLEVLVEHLISEGVHGIMTTGGTGEFPHLSREERKSVTSIVVTAARKRAPIIAGTAACSTREAIHLSQDAQEVGADAAIITAPFYFRLPESSLSDHYRTISHNVDIPIVVYNNPLYTGNPMSPRLMANLLGDGVAVGVKQSESDMGQLVELIRLAKEIPCATTPEADSSICTGIDSQFFPALCSGAAGIYSTAACVIPKKMVELYEAFRKGSITEARAIHERIQNLNRFLEYDPGYVSPCKEALNMLGLPGGIVRSPLPRLTESEREELKKALEDLENGR